MKLGLQPSTIKYQLPQILSCHKGGKFYYSWKEIKHKTNKIIQHHQGMRNLRPEVKQA